MLVDTPTLRVTVDTPTLRVTVDTPTLRVTVMNMWCASYVHLATWFTNQHCFHNAEVTTASQA